MAKKIETYIDTSALIALLDQSDTYHHHFVQLFNDPPRALTTPLVINEGHAWFLRRYDIYKAREFINCIKTMSFLQIHSVDSDLLTSSYRWIFKYHDQKLSLVDAMGLELMKLNKIKSCWSTDRHLALSGVPLAIAS